MRTLPNTMTCEQFLDLIHEWGFDSPKDFKLDYYVQGNRLFAFILFLTLVLSLVLVDT